MSTEGLNFAVVGATGLVGREILAILAERDISVASMRPLASAKSAGSYVDFNGEELVVEELTADSFKGIDVALFSAGGSISKEYGPIAVEAGAIVIDNSSAFRMVEQVPLTVPEVNGDDLRIRLSELSKGQGLLIANPNCSTIQLVVVLKPILDKVGLERVVVSTYQSVSGAGKHGMNELWNQCLAIFNQEEVVKKKFAHQIAFNCLPQIDVFMENGYSKEEIKVVNESRKVLSKPDLRITCTAVRVPVFSCHSESVNVETVEKLDAEAARKLLRESPGIMVLDSPEEAVYPLSADLVGSDATYVGRVRDDESLERGLNMWIVADNLRKGAALNAVQIAEIVISSKIPH